MDTLQLIPIFTYVACKNFNKNLLIGALLCPTLSMEIEHRKGITLCSSYRARKASINYIEDKYSTQTLDRCVLRNKNTPISFNLQVLFPPVPYELYQCYFYVYRDTEDSKL